MALLYSLLQDSLNTQKEGKNGLNHMQRNANLSGQAITEPLLYLRFQR